MILARMGLMSLLNFGCLIVLATILVADESKRSQATHEVDKSAQPRAIATTDGEVDDRSSMIRFLLYTCDFEVAGIVEVNSKFQKNGHSKELWIQEQLNAYERVLPNLRKHSSRYPDADSLRNVMRVGNENIKDLYVAPPEMEVKYTEGAQLIIDTLLDDDPRPVHVLSWGGPTQLRRLYGS